MSDYSALSRSGAINGSQSTQAQARALFLKKFANEVLTALPQVRSTLGMTMEKTLREGKEYQFPYTGRLSGSYHVHGSEIDGQVTQQNERVIGLDDLMVVPRFVPKIDAIMEHYDSRKPYADQMSEFLGITMDQHVFMEAIKGARQTAVVSGTDADGLVITNDKFQIDNVGTVGSLNNIELTNAIMGALEVAASNFKKKNVPKNLRKVLYVNPDIYYAMNTAVDTNGFSLFNKDYTNGSHSEGTLPMVFGIEIASTNNLPTEDLSSIPSAQDATNGIHFYHGADFSKTIGVIMCQGAVATVKGADIAMDIGQYETRYKVQLLTADYLAGHGWLRPECLVELKLDTLSNP